MPRDIAVAFLYAGGRVPRELAQIMVASVKHAMPHAQVVQLTDGNTKPIFGVDEVIRKYWDGQRLMPYRFLHMKEFPERNALFLDYDVVVQKDFSHLFEDDFDVGLTFRDKTDPSLRLAPLTREVMPYNTGVMLSKPSGRPFWEEAHSICLGMPEQSQGWWGDQLAIKALADRTTLKVRYYPCASFNYSPSRWDEDVSEKFVIHYKGQNRKLWMLRQWSHLLPRRK